MQAEQLFIKIDDVFKEVNAFVCGNCNMSNRTMEGAEQCCRCSRCKDKPRVQHYIYCEECKAIADKERKQKEDASDQAALDAATEVTEWEYVWYNERMYSDMDLLAEDITEAFPRFSDTPRYVFAMKPVMFEGFSLDDLIENYNESNMCEEVEVEDQVKGLELLKQAFEIFNIENEDTQVYWEEDRTRKVRVSYEQE